MKRIHRVRCPESDRYIIHVSTYRVMIMCALLLGLVYGLAIGLLIGALT